MTTLLECFDEEIVERTEEALVQAGIAFQRKAVSDGPLEGWKIEVDDTVAAEAVSILSIVTEAIDAARSPFTCVRCGAKMRVVDHESQSDRDEPLFIEYQCPDCGTSQLLNIE